MVSLTSIAFAQSATTGAIVGVAMDQAGAAVVGAKVTVVNDSTNSSAETTSSSTGDFRVLNLPPGRYTVTISAANFANYKAATVVEVGLTTRVDAKLNVSSKGEVVEVTDEAPLVNTEQHNFATNFNDKAINNLPINGRRWSNYALLTPTANPDGTFGLMSFRGISGLLNNFTIDGGDNNQNFYGEERGRTRLSYSVSQDSVREFQVNSSNFSSEYGRSAGGVVNTVTKSGTNNYHGSGYWYFRDNALGATNPSTTRLVAGVATPFKPDNRRQQFGATIGGPVIKDKVFFFFNWDQQTLNFPGVAIPLTGTNGFATYTPNSVAAPAGGCPGTGTLPNPSPTFTLGNGIFCRFAAGGNAATAQAMGQAAADAGFAFFSNLLGPNPRSGDQLIFFPKVDVKVWNGTWSTSYNWLNWTSPSGIQTQPTNTIARDQFGSDLVRSRTLNSAYSKALNSTTAMELRFHWSSENLSGDFQDTLAGQPSVAGPTGSRPPGAFIASWLNIGTQNYLPRPANPEEKQYQYDANFTFNLGRHTIKAGAQMLREQENVQSLFNAYGTFSFTGNYSFADFLADAYNPASGQLTGSGVRRCGTFATPTRPCYSTLTQGLGTLGYQFNVNDYSAFIQDDFKITPRLNLNFGLRYEYEELPQPQFANSILPVTANRPSDGNNWGPRGGFAWNIMGNNKLVLRGGYGLYYGRIINSVIASALTSTGVAAAQPSFSVSSSATSPLYPAILTAAVAGGNPPNVVYFDSSARNPMIHEADVILEYEFMRNTVASVSYMNSRGRGLINYLDTNLPTAYQGTNTFTLPGGGSFTVPTYGTAARPNASFNQITKIANTVDSDYNAVVLQVSRRLSHGLQFQSSYTYSKATDNGQNSQTFSTGNNALDPNVPQGEFGRSNFDVTHKFIFAGLWQPNYFKDSGNKAAHYILDDWTLAPIVNLSSGFVYTGTIGGSIPSTIPNPAPGRPVTAQSNCASSHSTGINCAAPGINRPANVEKNTFRAPARYTVDFRISRIFHPTEKTGFEFIAEAFNLFNHPNVSGMNSGQFNVGTCSGSTAFGNDLSCTLTNNATFGTPSSKDGGTNLRERQIQFALKFTF